MFCCFGRREEPSQHGRKKSPASSPATLPHSSTSTALPTGVLPGCDPVRVLGEGTFGTVVLVKERSTSVHFAVKIMNKAQLIEEDQVQNIIRERQILREAGPHPFIVECHSGFQTPDAVVLVLEYLSGGDMYDLLKVNGCLTETQARFYLAEVLLGLHELHRLSFVFRDLKLENILLDERGHVRLTDFGLSGRVTSPAWNDSSITDISGTAIYQAPEILAQAGHGRVVDMWALGVLAHVVLTGRPPFPLDPTSANPHADMYSRIRAQDIDLDAEPRLAHVSPDARAFIRALLERDPQKRLGAQDDGQRAIRAHPFFDGVDWDALARFKLQPPLPPPLNGAGHPTGSANAADSTAIPGPNVPDAAPLASRVAEQAQQLQPRPLQKQEQQQQQHPSNARPRTGTKNHTGAPAAYSAPDVAEVRKKVFDKLRGGAPAVAQASAHRRFRRNQSVTSLDEGEYKVVNVATATDSRRVSIGLDFQNRNTSAQNRTWTGTTDDFGRVLEE